LLLAMLFGSLALEAEKISERIRINGFLSQGFIYSTENDFIPNSSENGSFEMSELGLTLSVDISEKLRFGFQFLARDFGPIGNHNVRLDWGFADYRFSGAFGIRLGKIKVPFGLYNEVRDTDALHPMAILPQGVYDETLRGVFAGYNGLGLYGDLDLEAMGGLNYHLFVGSATHRSDAPHVQQINDAINLGLYLAGTGMSISQMEMHSKLLLGGQLMWKTPISGLKLGGSYFHHQVSYDSMLNIPLSTPAPISGRLEMKNAFALSGEFVLGNLTLTSEYMELPVAMYITLFDQELLLQDETMQGWYVMVSYLFGDKFTFSAVYDQFYADKGDTGGQSAIRQGNPGYFGWQKDLALGLRYDVNFNWTLKLEWHRLDGLAKSYLFTDIYNTGQKWNMIIAKAAFNF